MARGHEKPPRVAGVSHVRIRPACYQLMVVAHGRLPGEEPAQRAMAPDADAPACRGEETSRDRGRGEAKGRQRARGQKQRESSI